MAMNESECEAMIAEVERARVKLMIAYRLHFERGNLQAVEWVNSGKIGKPRIFNSIFSQQVRAGNSRLTKVGGGPIYDMGVYCKCCALLVSGGTGRGDGLNTGHESKRFLEVPATTTVVMRFPDERMASFTCSFGITDRFTFEVVGTKGMVKMDPAYEMVETLKVEMTVGKKTPNRSFPKARSICAKLIYFSDCIYRQDTWHPAAEGW